MQTPLKTYSVMGDVVSSIPGVLESIFDGSVDRILLVIDFYIYVWRTSRKSSIFHGSVPSTAFDMSVQYGFFDDTSNFDDARRRRVVYSVATYGYVGIVDSDRFDV